MTVNVTQDPGLGLSIKETKMLNALKKLTRLVTPARIIAVGFFITALGICLGWDQETINRINVLLYALLILIG